MNKVPLFSTMGEEDCHYKIARVAPYLFFFFASGERSAQEGASPSLSSPLFAFVRRRRRRNKALGCFAALLSWEI